MVRKFLKKLITAVMAAVMVMTSMSSVASVIMAAETPEEYRVFLKPSEHGRIAFAGEESVSEKTAAQGTSIALAVYADDGYEFSSFQIVDSMGTEINPGTIIQGNVLVMPGYDVAVSAAFREIPVTDPVIPEEIAAETLEEKTMETGIEAAEAAAVEEEPEKQDSDRTEDPNTGSGELSETPNDVTEELSQEETPQEGSPETEQTQEGAAQEVQEQVEDDRDEIDPEIPEETRQEKTDAEPGTDIEPDPDTKTDTETVQEPEIEQMEEAGEETGEEAAMRICVKVYGDGGNVTVSTENGIYTLLPAQDGQMGITGSLDAIREDPQYGLVLESTEAGEISLSAVPVEGYRISEYRILTDTGSEISEKISTGESYHTVLAFHPEAQYIEVGFEKIEPYFISDDFDYMPYYAMDFASLRLIVGAASQQDIKQPETIILDLGGVYVLQFADTETCAKAYAYYERNALFAEIDPVLDGESFNIALIDTGANGAMRSVSVMGSDPVDNSGHGSGMLSLIYGQNPGASVLSVKALDSEGYGDPAAIIAAIRYAISKGVPMIVLPLSAPAGADGGVASAIYEAIGCGITVVGPAGNNGADASGYVPGSIDPAVIVGAVNSEGELQFNSNYGATVDYNVTAASTSEASAIMAGWLSANGFGAIEDALNQGLIFAVDYQKTEETGETEVTDETDEIDENAVTDDIIQNPAGEEALPYKEQINEAADEELAGDANEEMKAVDCLVIKHTFVDRSKMPEGDYTINGLFRDDDADGVADYLDAFLGQKVTTVPLYQKEGSDYMFGYVDTLSSDGSELSDYLVAFNNDFGMVIEDYSYDPAAGIVYIPVSYRTEQEIGILAEPEINLQMQLLYVSEDSAAPSSKVNIIIRDEEGSELLNGYTEQGIYDDMLKISLIGTDSERIFDGYIQSVTLNGVRTEKYRYDEETGILYISDVTTSAVDVVEIIVGPETTDEEGSRFSAASGSYVFNGGGKITISGDVSSGAHALLTGTQVMYNYGQSTYQTSGLYHLDGGALIDNPNTAAAMARIASAAINGGTMSVSGMNSRSGNTTNYWNVYIPAGSYTFYTSAGDAVEVTIPEDIMEGLACTHVGISIAGGDNYIFQTYMPGGTAAQHPSEVWGYIDISASQPYQVSLNSSFQSYGAVSAGSNFGGYQWYNAPVSATIVATDDEAGLLYLAVASATAGSQSGSGVIAIPFTPLPKNGHAQFSKAVTTANGTLTVTKSVDAVKYADKTFSFTLEYGPDTAYGTTETFTLKNGQSYTKSLPAGTCYRITEDDYSADGWYTTVNGGSGFTRDRVTTGQMAAPSGSEVFSFTLEWDDGQTHDVQVLHNGTWTDKGTRSSGQSVDAMAGDTVKIFDLKDGSKVTVSETSPGGQWSGGGSVSGTVKADDTVEMGTITNTYIPAAKDVAFHNELRTGSIQIDKILDTTGFTAKAQEVIKNSSAYNVNGAQYTIYTDPACTQPYGSELLTITATDSTGLSGTSNVVDKVPFGTYYILETKAPNNLIADTTKHTVTIGWSNYETTQKPSTSPSKDLPDYGSVSLSKISANPGYTNGNPLYSLAGARYGIYLDRACSDLYAEAVTDATGAFKIDKVPFGTYYVKELQASPGYGLAQCATGGEADVHQVILMKTDKDKTVTCKEPADADPIRVLVQKIDKETKKPYSVGGATFAGAEYTVKYYMNYTYSGTPERTWVFVTNTAGRANLHPDFLRSGSNPLYKSEAGTFVIPRGSFTIQETKAPTGYEIDPTTYRYQVNGNEITYAGNDSGLHPISTTPTLQIDKGQNSEEQVYRGNFEFKKVLDGSERIANCLFEVTNTTTGEVHYIVTDPNGVYNSNLFTKNNGNDAAVRKNSDGSYTVNEAALSYQNNVYFSMDTAGNTATPNQNYASYPYGTYTFHEIQTSVNTGLPMITFTGTVYREGFYLNDQENYDLGTKDDRQEGTPLIHTIARDSEELDKMIDIDDSDCDIIDKISYENLNKGEAYVLKGKVWDKTNGTFYKDASGNEYTVIKTFTASGADGYTEVTFDLDPDILKAMETKAIVIFEWLYKDDELLVTHADPEDQDQGIVVIQPPQISTTLGDSVDGEHDALASKGMVLNDTVHYENLKAGRTYRIDGVLMDKATGKPAVDDNGEQITATTTFKASEEEGTIVLPFTFDGVSLADHTVVAFESLYWRNIEQALHRDLEDEGQTLYIPEISTTLKDSVDDDKDALAAEKIVLIDTVEYSNLIPGKTYVMSGVLMDKKTGEPALDDNGNEITSQTTFTPDSANGEVELAFTFSGVNLAGESVVAFETLERGGKEVAVHADINDEDQTVDIPKIETTLADIIDGEHDALAAEDITLVDTVAYSNLIVGRNYTMKGILMDQETGEAILDDDGEQITSEAAFTAESKDGTVELEFAFKGVTLAGKTVVAFEELYRDGKKVAVHADIEDEAQTVDIPEIGTTLTDTVDGDKDAFAGEDIVLVDTVEYHNLIAGRDYTVTGKLYDQETGDPALDDAGNEITARSSFTAESKDGSVEITFTFSGVDLAGHSVVAFENLYRDEKLVAVHADIEDQDQTVYIPKIETTLADTFDREHDTVAKENIQLVDTVQYTNLIPGREYTMTGILMDKETGEEMLDDDGNTITAGATFTPETPDGSVDIIFIFNGVSLAGRSVVAFEDLYREGKHVAVHADIEDEDQTVFIPEIGTTLKDKIDGEHDALAADNITLVDTVSYKNLIPGHEYRMHGILMDQETGEPAMDDEGNMIESEASFVPVEKDGSIDIAFTFSGVTLQDHTVVAFERLYRDDKLVALHCEIDDFDQSVWIPEIRTTLEDSIDGGKDAYAAENIRLVDTVVYQNLLPGKEYTVSGKLHDKETGQPALDDNGNEITAETAFVAEEANGSVEVIFEFSGVNLAGRSVVAFEDLYREGKKVAVHADINDEDQTVHLPKIGTTLTDALTGLHNTRKGDTVTLVDTVAYENLIEGREYVMKGVLMDKASGRAILNRDGTEAAAEAAFTADGESGTVELVFKLDNIPEEGITAVAFETLYRKVENGTEKTVADHKDIEDMDQTVSVPSIGTTLTTRTGLKTVNYLNTVTLFDEVEYRNLRPGAVYTVEGKLMDKATGLSLKDKSGKEVTAKGEFTAESTSGSFSLAFTFECGEDMPPAIVAFEYLYESETLIAEHEDLQDEDQTVYTLVMATTALNSLGTKQFEAAAANKVIDRVDYKGLEPGRSYTLFGTIVEQGTGKRLQYKNQDLSGSITFTPETKDGSVNVEIEVPAGVFVGTAVVFEQLLDGKTGNVICTHEDVDDKAQTVYFAEAKTSAVNKADNSRRANLISQVTIEDTLTYKGLEPGREYEVTATLMNKTTGRVVTSLRVPVISKKTFTPEMTDGTIKMELVVPQRTVNGDTVCFEVIRDKETGSVVCRHEDLNDKDQTVTFYAPPSTPVIPRTGDETSILLWIIIMAAALAAAAAILLVMKKRKKR